LFAQRQFGLPFVQVAASQSHHHSEAGGLLLQNWQIFHAVLHS